MFFKVKSVNVVITVCYVVCCALCCIAVSSSYADSLTFVYTPNGTSVSAFVRTEFNPDVIEMLNETYKRNYPNAVFASGASRTYNCHAYAWHSTNPLNNVWINPPNQETYWLDGSYQINNNPGAVSKTRYLSDDHSALSFMEFYFSSKWGSAPAFRHAYDYSPYDSSSLEFYN